MIPRATYRLQFNKDFNFDQAAMIAPYLARLGVSHVYASPWLRARPGSSHGYDIVDHQALNPELGDDAAFHRMVAAFQANGLHQILDFVPNHMGVGGADNPLWLDVLEWGPDSPHAGWFDIDWYSDSLYLREKLLVPFLADQYGNELRNGKLLLKCDQEEGSFALWAYGAHKLPICPLHYARILGDAHPELERLGDAFTNLPAWRPQVARRAADLKAELARHIRSSRDVQEAVAVCLARLNGTAGDEASWRPLHALIEDQYWRAAHFRVAADDINYRRFFNINDLAGLRMELPEVFDHAHTLVFRLLRNGTLDGLRIDHVDGLLDPKAYLQRLRTAASAQEGIRPFYLVVEKILAPHEDLRDDWPVEGTTGYEFANLVLGLLMDPSGEEPLTRLYHDFTGQRQTFRQVVRDCKLRIMNNEMASELNVLAREAARVARQHPRTADFTHNILHRGLREVVACFPVYRTYVDTEGAPSAADRRDLEWALTQARANETDIDPSVFDFIAQLLSGDLVAHGQSGFSRYAVLRCAMKLQQYSGPIMAKGLEDTAFYRYNRFVALNEVGGHPDKFAVGVSAFHEANTQRAKRWPNAMLGTSTHDTKRGEDTRARLAVLSEMPEEWARQVQAWSRILRARRGDIEGIAPPDRNDEYVLYQLLLGTWPAELTGVDHLDQDAVRRYSERLKGALKKSIREAKVHSTWASPNTAYEEAVFSFVDDALDLERAGTFVAAFLPFQERIARLGMQNSLVQVALKLTLPGVPDIYQGAELWDLSLVDPDNRRPIDYEVRMRLVEEIVEGSAEDRHKRLRSLYDRWQDGAVKLALTIAILEFRRKNRVLFAQGDYQALTIHGPKAEQVCAFLRRSPEHMLLVVACRFPSRREGEGWGATTIAAPGDQPVKRWQDMLTGTVVEMGQTGLDVEAVSGHFPVALLVPL
jgi:(1->4)-alpha-D-glucan 1-alpha-D-glucosylmutase